MELIVSLLVFVSMFVFIQNLPIYNGFTVKLNDLSPREYKKPKTFGALFERTSQDAEEPEPSRSTTKTNTNLPYTAELGTGCTNQIAKIVFPMRITERDYNDSRTWKNAQFINIPLIGPPLTAYKILVATAPPNMRLSRSDKDRVVVYIVFPEDDSNDNSALNIPSIYFVRKLSEKNNRNKKEIEDPIFIIDNNRTVTGLKSKEVAKYVKFKNLLNRQYDYQLIR